MFKAAAATAAVVLLCASLALAAPVAELSLDPVSSLNVTAYKGLWYQMYGDRLTDVSHLGIEQVSVGPLISASTRSHCT